MSYAVSFGRRPDHHRRGAGLSQERLAVDPGVARGWVSQRGGQKGDTFLNLLDRLAKALNVPVAVLLAEPKPGAEPPQPLPNGRKLEDRRRSVQARAVMTTARTLSGARGKFALFVASLFQHDGLASMKEFGELLAVFAEAVADTDPEAAASLKGWAATYRGAIAY